jgi:hypothetical protein
VQNTYIFLKLKLIIKIKITVTVHYQGNPYDIFTLISFHLAYPAFAPMIRIKNIDRKEEEY